MACMSATGVAMASKQREIEISPHYSVVKAGTLSDRIVARMRQLMFERFLDSTGIAAEETVLDVGASSDDRLEAANFLEAWYPYKDKITACGIDDASFLEQRYPGLRFVRGDGRSLPFPDDAFDVVHSNAVLEHVGDREQQGRFISELVRVSRRKVFLTTPNRWYPIEFHSVLPLVHWLPPAAFRKFLSAIGHRELSLEENLNLLGRGDLVSLCETLRLRAYHADSVRLLGWPSNLLLTIDKRG